LFGRGGRTLGARRWRCHETRFWGEEIDKLVKDKRQKFLTLHHTGNKSDNQAYAVAKSVLKKVVTKAKGTERLDFIADMEEPHMKGIIFKMSKQMNVKNKNVIGPRGIRNAAGKIISGGEASINVWKQYYSTLLNEEFDWNRGSLREQPAVIGPAE